MKTILALDAGTTNVKAILVDQQGKGATRGSLPVQTHFPKDGWGEQSAAEILGAARRAIEEARANGSEHEVVALGISNQRETVVAWNRQTGKAVHPCIVWQCRRSAF